MSRPRLDAKTPGDPRAAPVGSQAPEARDLLLDFLTSILSSSRRVETLEQVLEIAVVKIAAKLPTVRVSYAAVDASGRLSVRRTCRAGRSDLTGLETAPPLTPEHLATLRRGEAVVVDDARSHALERPQEAIETDGLGALLDAPVLGPEGLVGILRLDAPEPREWTADERRALLGVSVAAGLASRFVRRGPVATEDLDALIENSPLAIVETDTSGRVTFCNPSFERLFRYKEAEILGRDLDALIGPEDASEETGEITRQCLGGEVVRRTTRRCRKDGSLVDVELHAVPLKLGGEVVGSYALYQDITARCRAEEALRASEDRFRRLVETANVIPWEFDLRTMRFTYVGPQTARILGHPTAAWYAEGFWESHIHPEDRKPTVETCLAAAARFMDHDLEYRMLAADGRTVWVRSIVSVASNPDGSITLHGLLLDVAERKAAEAEIVRAREAAIEVARIRSQFLASMSHEIRTPIHGILNMTGLLLDTEVSSEQRDLLATIRSSADNLLALLNGILDFSKIEAGRLDFESIPFSLHEILMEAFRTCGLRATEKGLDLLCDADDGLPVTLVGDPYRLRQILANLMGNAIKFTDRGGVRVAVQSDRIENGAVVLHFTVSDSGIGVAPDKRRSIFEPFVQADGSTARRYGGTGLGLAITAQLVEGMGGRIWVESEVGRGSDFHFTVRLGLGASEEAPTARRSGALRDLHVLVVEDNSFAAAAVSRILSRRGMRPSVAPSARAAFALVEAAREERDPFAAAVLDGEVAADHGNGRSLLGAPELRTIPSVVVTTRPGAGGPAATRRSPRLLPKPVFSGDLLAAMEDILSEAREGAAKGSEHPVPAPAPARASLRVLVAEDNPIHQMVILRLLEKRGHRPVVVNDGEEALHAAGRDTFDVVLLDLHMPGLDGPETAARLRRVETGTGRRVPIFALTADGLEGARERCLSAGMDGYLTKPIQASELYAAIERPVAGAVEARAAMDHKLLLEEVGGDRRFLATLAKTFLENYPATSASLEEALTCRSADRVRMLAHRLKGSLGTLAAGTAREAAAKVEEAARNGNLEQALAAWQITRREIERLRPELSALAEEKTGA